MDSGGGANPAPGAPEPRSTLPIPTSTDARARTSAPEVIQIPRVALKLKPKPATLDDDEYGAVSILIPSCTSIPTSVLTTSTSISAADIKLLCEGGRSRCGCPRVRRGRKRQGRDGVGSEIGIAGGPGGARTQGAVQQTRNEWEERAGTCGLLKSEPVHVGGARSSSESALRVPVRVWEVRGELSARRLEEGVDMSGGGIEESSNEASTIAIRCEQRCGRREGEDRGELEFGRAGAEEEKYGEEIDGMTRKLRCTIYCAVRAVDVQQDGGDCDRAEDACVVAVGFIRKYSKVREKTKGRADMPALSFYTQQVNEADEMGRRELYRKRTPWKPRAPRLERRS
ncbi:hypothetical protein B0H13DRAFT_1910649 [Mycena leptocephala]|nr:hypothetical protein B0H13DRAFT_1910649 [Mycena leptocephala]